MKTVVNCEQMKQLDEHTILEKGVPACVLMERAALATIKAMKPFMKEREKILIICGSGNNGGDGIAIARILTLEGYDAEIFMAGNPAHMTEETSRQWKIARNYSVPMVNNPKWSEYTTIVDAMFGIGLSRPVEGRYGEILQEANRASAWKVSVDIPSGIDGNSGFEMGIAFRAGLTVTFGFVKRGLCFYPGRMYAGNVVVADIGIYEEKGIPADTWYLEQEDLKLLPQRIPYGNKGTFGKVLLVGGSSGMCGAAFLSAQAALRAGAGMVKIQTVEENRVPLQTLLPEAMVTCEFEEEANQKMLDWCDVLIIGPGLGVSGHSRERVQWFLERGSRAGKPIILDADGLNLLALHPAWLEYLNENVVVTPHIGEMSRLCKKTIGEIQGCLVETAGAYAKETKAICVLKDACTVAADARGRRYLNVSGNVGMATAGSGDVLTGILAAVFCMYLSKQEGGSGTDPLRKAALGVCIHGMAGDEAVKKTGTRGMTARDILDSLPKVLA